MNTKHEKFCDIHGCQLEERINVMEQIHFVCSVCEEENNIYRFDSTKEIEESLRCKFSWENCDNSYLSICDYCERNDISKQKIGDYYKNCNEHYHDTI